MVIAIKDNNKEKIGSIYYDKRDKRWRCIYYIYDQNTYNEIRKTKSFSTEQEAKEFLTSIQYQKGNNSFIKNNGIPLNQLMRENVEKKLELNLIGERTYNRILKTIKQIEKAPVTKENIIDITSNDIQNYFNTLKDYSTSTIKKITEQFSQAFELAINKGYLFRNPMRDVIKPKSTKDKKVVRALEIEEQQALTDYLTSIPISQEPYKVAYLIEMYLGLRIGEVLALRSTDINLQKNLLLVNKTLTRDKNDKVIMGKATKTYAGIREVPIPSFIRNDIINQMKLAENNKDKQLFLDTNGNYVRPTTANDKLKALLKRLGIENISSHSLRHTYGTRCIEAGMRAVALQRLMGHTDVSVTMNTYTTVFNKYKEAELEKVNDYYINNAIISSTQHVLLEDNTDLEKNNSIFQKKLQDLTKMIEDFSTKCLISIEEYKENIDFLQELQTYFDNEEKGEFER